MQKQLCIFTSALLAAIAAVAQPRANDDLPPIRVILVGDSTVAPKNGWGPGFCNDVAPHVTCLNLAKNGRSTSSYRAEGSWERVMAEVKNNAAFRATYVLIQFGHNDQPGKPGRSTDLATEFPANLHRYIQEVTAAGGNPILVTPLARRMFHEGILKNDLQPWGESAKKVAAEEGIPALDLNTDSVTAVQRMGPVEANTLAMAPPPPAVAASAASGTSAPAPKTPPGVEPNADSSALFDYTHLGEKGAALFGRMVADELIRAVPELRPYIKE